MSLDFAQDDSEAEERFANYKKNDPFPSIPPSLLNAGDVADYVAATGMVCPFDVDKLKSGSYEAKILGKCYWWDEKGKKHEEELVNKMDRFELKPNSLVYVQVEPKFRLPDYIALRFNLKITHVHRGILLGTGPLIDPGFEGKLLIPLHNFSNNSYTLKAEDGLIWLEFTKLSPIRRYEGDIEPKAPLVGDARDREGEYIPFLNDKKNKDPDYYFSKASEWSSKPNVPTFFSSVKEIHRETSLKIDSFKSTIELFRTEIRDLKRIGVGAITLAIVAMLVPTWTLIHDARNAHDQKWQKLLDGSSVQKEILHTLENKVRTQQAQVESFEILMDKFESQQDQIRALKAKIVGMSVNQSTPAITDVQQKARQSTTKPQPAK